MVFEIFRKESGALNFYMYALFLTLPQKYGLRGSEGLRRLGSKGLISLSVPKI